jgi:hypothetical protein
VLICEKGEKMRLIDADALLDRIRNPYEQAEVARWVNEQSTVNQWIPCSERMPEPGQGCLVCDKGQILIDTFIGYGNPYNWKWYVRDYEAWMPLPEPWKENT